MSEMGGRWPVGASIDKKKSIFLGKNSHFFGFFFVSTLPSVGHSAKALPSARQKTLGKATFVDPFFAEWSLPSANWSLPSAPGTRQSH